MENKKYLNEEKYQKTEKKITLIAVLVLVFGLCVGGLLIYNGVAKPNASKVDDLKIELETKKSELISKGIEFDYLAKYDDGEVYDLKVITKALDPSFDYCAFDEYKNNSITKEYCSAKNSIGEMATVSSIMIGVFLCIVSCMISFVMFTFAKERHILAFQAQKVMPVAKEAIDEVAPTIGNAAGSIAKGVTKGIKDGLKDESDEN